MLHDVWTVAWKDWQEMLRASGSVRSGWLRLLAIPAIFGIFVPLQTGSDWVVRPEALLGNAWVPILIVLGVIADSFAGERERHTLETLLATRLSDHSILYGKIAAAVALGWGSTLLALLLALLTANVVHGHGRLLLYTPRLALAALALSFLEALLTASAGALVSLHAPTVRQAQQTLSFGAAAIFALALSPFLAWYVMPGIRQAPFLRFAAAAGPAQIAAGAALVLAALDAALLAAALARFRRARLILD